MANLPESLRRPIDTLLIDNFDSFTWNLYQQLTLLGTDVTVIRNNAIDAASLPFLDIKRLIISPGPGHPRTDSGISRDAVRFFTGKVPILGVCMGLEVVVDVFGGEIAYAGEIKHGKLSPIRHDNRGVFANLPQSFQSTRYHSLSASIKSLPDVLAITAATEESGVIMGVRHRQFAIEAVQYHPESVLSEEGDSLLKNFLNLRGGSWDENPVTRVKDLSLPPFPIDFPSASAQKQQKPSTKLPTILEKIHIQRLKDIEAAKSTPGTSLEDLESLLSMSLAPPLIPVVSRLHTTPQTSPALMAEIKRASPSKGPIAPHANAAQQAVTYALAGASVVSVLTEPTWFKGSLLDMRLARQALDTLPNRPAVLRKDFIVDEYQIAEARLHGADTVLLIVALLPVERLKNLYEYSKKLGMEPLVEVNSAAEMEAALQIGARVIGVNNRNLHNFEVDMSTTSRLVGMIGGKDVILCALSGISGPEDVRVYKEQGIQAVLIGEALMRASSPQAFISGLLGWELPTQNIAAEDQPPLVKICGIRTVDEALTAAQAGADMLGLVFVPTSKRLIKLDVACRISHAIRERRAQAATESESVGLVTSQEINPSGTEVQNQVPNAPWFSTHASRLSHILRQDPDSSSARPQLVGVFQNQSLSEILNVVAAAQLDIVQLHGDEPLHWSDQMPVPVIRAFHLGPTREDGTIGGLEGITRPGLHKFVLLDAMREDGLSGGSGKVVDWEVAKSVVETGEVGPFPLAFRPASASLSPSTNGAVNGHTNGHEHAEPLNSSSSPTNTSPASRSQSITVITTPTDTRTSSGTHARLPVILAGGLTPSNIHLAISRVRPWAVDVSGGVERSDGVGKDLEKVVAFVRAAKGLGLGGLTRTSSNLEEEEKGEGEDERNVTQEEGEREEEGKEN